MVKAIFIDIDGTLRDSNKNLSVKTIDTIKKATEKGILVILCSGRPRKYTEQISRECFTSKYIILLQVVAIFMIMNKIKLYMSIK